MQTRAGCPVTFTAKSASQKGVKRCPQMTCEPILHLSRKKDTSSFSPSSDKRAMKVWATATFSVAVFLAYSLVQYCRESAALHAEIHQLQRVKGMLSSVPLARPAHSAEKNVQSSVRRTSEFSRNLRGESR
jgi:hypothetical protein